MTRSLSSKLTSLFESENERVWRVFRRLGCSDSMAARRVNDTFRSLVTQLSHETTGRERELLLRTMADVARAKTRGEPLPPVGVAAKNTGPVTAQAQGDSSTTILDSLLATLSIDAALVFVLFELEGLPTATIAFALRMNEVELRELVHRARETYRAALRRRLGVDPVQVAMSGCTRDADLAKLANA